MAAVARSAPVPAPGAPDAATAAAAATRSPPPAAPERSSSLDDTISLIRKIQIGVQEAHRAHITAELVLNSDKGQFSVMAKNIGVPVFPVLHVTPESAPTSLQEAMLVQMSQGVLLHKTLLGLMAPHLTPPDPLMELRADTSDLLRHLYKLLRATRAKREAATTAGTTAAGTTAAVTMSTKPLEEVSVAPVLNLRLNSEFHIQVAMHLALQGLQDFSQDMERVLRPLVKANDKDTAKAPGPM